jgi:hypothetical protein
MKDSITVRLNARTRFGLELMKRRHHETLTKTLIRILEKEIERDSSIEQILEKTWDVNEETRIKKLAKYYPELLIFEEERWLKDDKNQ